MKKILLCIALAFSLSVSVRAIGLDTLKISLPSLHWALQLKLPGYELENMDMNKQVEGRYVSAYNDSLGMYISIEMAENNRNFNNAIEMRNASWAQSKHYFAEQKAMVLDTARYELGNCAMADFLIISLNGQPGKQRNIVANIIRNNICITIQVIKSNYVDDDVDCFADILSNMKFIAPYNHVSIEHFMDGTIYFDNGNYLLASKILQKALDLDKIDQALNQNQMYLLISDLGLAYGLSRRTRQAIAVLNDGIALDRFFPMFYYNLAAVYAQADDLVETIYYLSHAYLYKKNMPKGAEFPNPKKDVLFKKYWKNEKFREALRSMD